MIIKNGTQKILNQEASINKLIIVDYFASWCGPCQMFGPVFEEYANNNSEIYIKINVDEESAAAAAANVQSIPTLVIMKDGKEVSRKMGYLSVQELDAFIKEHR